MSRRFLLLFNIDWYFLLNRLRTLCVSPLTFCTLTLFNLALLGQIGFLNFSCSYIHILQGYQRRTKWPISIFFLFWSSFLLGIFAVPRDLCVQQYYKAVKSFNKDYLGKGLRDIHFVDRIHGQGDTGYTSNARRSPINEFYIFKGYLIYRVK